MEVILVDTNLLIDYKRATSKEQTLLVGLSARYTLAISVITVFELLRGDNLAEDRYWLSIFSEMQILDFNFTCCFEAARIYKELRAKGQPIGIEDVLIAAIALTNQLPLATSNHRHFSWIDGLTLLDL